MDKIKNLAQILSSLEMSANDKRQLINYLNNLNKENISSEMDSRYKPNSSFMDVEVNQYIKINEMSADDERFENKKNEIFEKLNKGIDIIEFNNNYYKVNYYYAYSTDYIEIFGYRINNNTRNNITEFINLYIKIEPTNGIKNIFINNYNMQSVFELQVVFNYDKTLVTQSTTFNNRFKADKYNRIVATRQKLIDNKLGLNGYLNIQPNDVLYVTFRDHNGDFNNYIFRYIEDDNNNRYTFKGEIGDKIIKITLNNAAGNGLNIDLTPFIDYVNELS